MKLLNKYRRYTYTILVCVALASFIVHYYLFRYSIHRTTDDVLNEYRIDIENYAAEKKTLEPFRSLDMRLSTLKVKTNLGCCEDVNDDICDTLVFSHYENEMVVYRKLEFPVVTPHQSYTVLLMLPTLEEDDLVGKVFLSLIIIILFFILFSTITDFVFRKKFVHPFRKILETIRTYKIESPSKIEMQNCKIEELQELAKIVMGMMDKINRDYSEMKDFLENTSHELQTPLSIIQLKLDEINQCEIDDEVLLRNLASIRKSLTRIIRFNRSLLLIAKINNNQFSDTERISLNTYLEQTIRMYEEMLSIRNIKLTYHNRGLFMVDMHAMLAEQFVQNILINAVKHNDDGGFIELSISEKLIELKNSFSGPLPNGDLFKKYNCNKNTIDSNGLGLAIVKNICEKNNLDISYTIDNHIFDIKITHKRRFHPSYAENGNGTMSTDNYS